MLTKTVTPKTKADLIRALQAVSIRSVEVLEADRLEQIPSAGDLRRNGKSVIVLS